MAILGIETSCDETAIAVIDSLSKKILCEALFSQIDLHNLYGGSWYGHRTPWIAGKTESL